MSQWNEGIKTFPAGEDLAKRRRVKMNSSSEVVYADAGENYVGVTEYAADDGDLVAVRMKNYPGTFKVSAAGAFSIGDDLWGALDGQVDDTPSGFAQFIAIEAATAADDIVEAVPSEEGFDYQASGVLDIQDIHATGSFTTDTVGTTVEDGYIKGHNGTSAVKIPYWYDA